MKKTITELICEMEIKWVKKMNAYFSKSEVIRAQDIIAWSQWSFSDLILSITREHGELTRTCYDFIKATEEEVAEDLWNNKMMDTSGMHKIYIINLMSHCLKSLKCTLNEMGEDFIEERL